jgi:hypothetical protein
MAASLAFILLTTALTWPQVLDLQDSVADHDDALFSIWRLSWVAYQLPRDPAHLFDANIFYPHSGTLAYSDAMLAVALMAAPMLWAGIAPALVYNIVLLAAFVASGLAASLLVAALTGRMAAGVVAGIVFAFAPYRFGHYAHLELQWSVWMPLTLWALHRSLDSSRGRDAALAGAFLALQFLSSLYYGIYFAIYLAVVVPAILAVRRIGVTDARVWRLAASVAVAAVLLVPYGSPYESNRQSIGVRPLSEIAQYSARLGDYATVPPENRLYGGVAAGSGERWLFPGLAPIGLAVVGAASAGWPAVPFIAGTLVAIEGSRGLNSVVYRWLLDRVDVLSGLRVPARFGMLVCLSIAVLAGFGAAHLLRRRGGRAIVAALVIVMVIEFWSAPVALLRLPSRLPPEYQFLQTQPPGVVIEFPLPRADALHWIYDGLYMYFSVFHWHRLVNGYSGFYPQGYLRTIERLVGFPDADSVPLLRTLGTDYVVVHGPYYEPAAYEQLLLALNAHPELVLTARFPGHPADTRVYRLLSAPAEAAPGAP